MSVRALFIAGALMAVAPSLSGQEPDGPQPSSRIAFEVASVRPNNSGPGSAFMRCLPGGGFEAGNVTPRDLIIVAYDMQRFYLVAVPSWAENERFDISARAGASPPTGANAEMLILRTLLEERFRLAVHTETQDVQVYALVLARRDGQLGPQLRRSQTDCTAAASSARGAAPPPGAAGAAQCGSRNGPGFIAGVGREVSSLVFPSQDTYSARSWTAQV